MVRILLRSMCLPCRALQTKPVTNSNDRKKTSVAALLEKPFNCCLTFTLYGYQRNSLQAILLNVSADNPMLFLLAEILLGLFSNIFLTCSLQNEQSFVRISSFYIGSFHVNGIFNILLERLFERWYMIKSLRNCCLNCNGVFFRNIFPQQKLALPLIIETL